MPNYIQVQGKQIGNLYVNGKKMQQAYVNGEMVYQAHVSRWSTVWTGSKDVSSEQSLSAAAFASSVDFSRPTRLQGKVIVSDGSDTQTSEFSLKEISSDASHPTELYRDYASDESIGAERLVYVAVYRNASRLVVSQMQNYFTYGEMRSDYDLCLRITQIDQFA